MTAAAAAPTSVVGDVTIAERTLEAAFEHFPARGRLAVDRITISERERVQRFLPGLEIDRFVGAHTASLAPSS